MMMCQALSSDSRTYRRGYHLNMFLMTLNNAEIRAEFAQDEAAYLDKFKLTQEQRATTGAPLS